MKVNFLAQPTLSEPIKVMGVRLFYTMAIATSLCMSLANSAAAHHGGNHTIAVDRSGQTYEKLGPNWQQITMSSAAGIGGLSLLGLGSYWLKNSRSQQYNKR